MSLSITEIARMHKSNILKQLSNFEEQLHPSSEEDQELVRRAVFSVRNRSVIFERYVPFSTNLYAIVQDVKSPQVIIEFSNEKMSCSCPASSVCRHELAVLLSLFQYFDSVQDWASRWRSKKNIQLESLATERTPENWRKLIDEVMQPHLSSDKKLEGYAIMTVVEMVRTRLNRFTPYEREWIPVYKLFCELGMFNHILRQNASNAYQDSNHTYYMQYYADKAFDRMKDLLEEFSTQSKLFAIDPFYDELQNMVFELLLQTTKLKSLQMELYLLFWKRLFSNEERIQNELKKLEDYQAHNGQLNELNPIKIVFYMLLKDMQSIDELLKTISSDEIELYLLAVQFANDNQLPEVSNKILKAILPYIHDFFNHTLPPMQRQQFAFRVDQLFENVTLSEEDGMMLYSSLGKYGLQPFSTFLIRNGRYDEWAALHQLNPSSLSYLETCGLKMVSAEAPAVTLPLYHHFAMEELKHKSRVNYKQAVRIWKSMRSAAKKAGKTTYFENYMYVIRTENKRLRALQEELDKGNF